MALSRCLDVVHFESVLNVQSVKHFGALDQCHLLCLLRVWSESASEFQLQLALQSHFLQNDIFDLGLRLFELCLRGIEGHAKFDIVLLEFACIDWVLCSQLCNLQVLLLVDVQMLNCLLAAFLH